MRFRSDLLNPLSHTASITLQVLQQILESTTPYEALIEIVFGFLQLPKNGEVFSAHPALTIAPHP